MNAPICGGPACKSAMLRQPATEHKRRVLDLAQTIDLILDVQEVAPDLVATRDDPWWYEHCLGAYESFDSATFRRAMGAVRGEQAQLTLLEAVTI